MAENISCVSILIAAIAAFAALCSAIAAYNSNKVSKDALKFQKKLVKNQGLLNKLNSTMANVITLRRYWGNSPSESISDDEFRLINPLFEDIKSDLEQLNGWGRFEYPSKNRPTKIIELDDANNYLSEILSRLQTEHDNVFK